jgi:hypothetical protein
MAESTEHEQAVDELALLLLYLTSWEEELIRGGPTVRRAWKNIRFEVLDSLAEQGYLETKNRAKSIYITEQGLRKAQQLQKKYLGR